MSFPDLLASQLTAPLPGHSAQHKMATLRRIEQLGLPAVPPPDVRMAAVLLLLFQQEQIWRLTLIQRTVNPRDRHSGQISFPGGRYEPEDGQLTYTALREVHEEIGLLPARIRILGKLTELHVPVSNFMVHPFVGVLNEEETPAFSPQPGEVDAILTPPLSLFLDENLRKTTDLTVGAGILLKNVPYFEIEGRIIWGATAMILSEFLEVLNGIEPDFYNTKSV